MKTIRIDGAIGSDNNTAEAFINRVEGLNLEENESLTVIVNSQGGHVFEGYGIYAFLRRIHEAGNQVFTVVSGYACSIATLIVMSAPKENTSIDKVSSWMIHGASSPQGGTVAEMEESIELLNTINATLKAEYMERSGKSDEKITLIMSKDSWFNSESSVNEGFIGKTGDYKPIEANAQLNFNKSKTISMSLKSILATLTGEGDEEKKKEEMINETEEEKVIREEEEKKKEEEEAKALEEEEKKKEEAGLDAKFNALSDKFEALLVALSDDEKKKEEETATAKAELDEDEEKKKEEAEAKETAELIESVIAKEVTNAIASLKSSNGGVPHAGNPMSTGYKATGGAKRMQAISKRTRN